MVVGRECKYAELQVPAPRRPSRGQSRSKSPLPTPLPTPLPDAINTLHGSPGVEQASPASTTTATAYSACSHISPGSTVSSTVAPPNVPHIAAPVPPHIRNLVDDDGLDHQVNMNHMELLLHFSGTVIIPDMDKEFVETATEIVMRKSLDNACLMHQVLALSARHLAIERPERYDFYCHLAMRLQTRAIELFNATSTIDQSNCEALLLFTSFLNQHVLTDVLSNREGNFTDFLDRFIDSAKLQRGIKIVTDKRWLFLLESDLSPLLQKGNTESLDRPTSGKECDLLQQLISISTMDPVAKESCRTAIHFLQLGFDTLTSTPKGSSRDFWAARWTLFLPPEFLKLLEQRRPEAVTIMGWYAVLLGHGKQNWTVGDAGTFLLHGVDSFLGPEWAHWLEWPRAMMADMARLTY